MAILDRITIGSKEIVVVDTDPTIDGVDVPVGSLILMNDGSGSYLKTDVTDTAWTKNIKADDAVLSAASVGTFGITINNSNAEITTGIKNYIIIPYDCTITGYNIIADVVGDCVIDVWKNTTIPTVLDTITGSQKPALVAQITNSDLSLNTWTVSVNAGDIIAFAVESANTIKKITLTISVIKI